MVTKFLIIRFSSIGDIVLTSPVVRNLKIQVEDAEIHFLTKDIYKDILINNPYIDKVHTLKNSFKVVINDLKAESFDYIIDLHNNLRTARVKFALKRMSFTFKKLNWEKWLITNFKINKLPKVHIVDRYLDTIGHFIEKPDDEGLNYFLPVKDEMNLLKLPKDFPYGYIAFAIGAKHTTKKLPPVKIASICKLIEYNVILLGGTEDKEAGDWIVLNSGDHVINRCGVFNLNQSASILRQAKLVISHDSGLMHIAAAFRKRIISIWGNTVPAFGMYPYKPDDKSLIVELKNVPCRPCSKIGFKRCPKKHFKCMQMINEKLVADVALLLTLDAFDQKYE